MSRFITNTILVAVGAVVGSLFGGWQSGDVSRQSEMRSEAQRLKRSEVVGLVGSTPKRLPKQGRTPDVNASGAEDFATQAQRQREQNMVDDWIQKLSLSREKEYEVIFNDLGLTAEQRAGALSKLTEIHRQAVKAGEPARELGEMKLAYAQTIKSMVGEEKYASYRAWELMKPAGRELALIKDSIKQAGGDPIDEAQGKTLLRLIHEAGATSTEAWLGPYDPPPRPIVGDDGIVQEFRSQRAALRSQSQELLAAARDSGIPQTTIDVLNAYYSNLLASKQTAIRQMGRPEAEQAAERSNAARERYEAIQKARAAAQAKPQN